MYVDDNSSSELDVTLDGHEYAEQENYDANHDGVHDAVSIDDGHGGHIVYVDTTADGHADEVDIYDAQGHLTETGHYDATSGTWDRDAQLSTHADHAYATSDGKPEDITITTSKGTIDAGVATVDANGDGKLDTATVTQPDGTTILATDITGDGKADILTEFDTKGNVEILHRTGESDWTETEKGHLDANGQYHKDADPGSDQLWTQTPSGLATTIDPATGEWV
jgi:hypothetical protein